MNTRHGNLGAQQLGCDVAIVGGGPVGAALALALGGSGLDVRVLEARAPGSALADPRALALSYGSRLLLERLGVWGAIPQVSGIRTIHISQQHAFGRTLLEAAEAGVPEMGYVLPYHALHAALAAGLQNAAGVSLLTGAAVNRLEPGSEAATLGYRLGNDECTLRTRLAVIADGGKLLEATLPPQVTDYGQSAVIAHVTCALLHSGTAYERFTAQGPVALLPYMDGYELVWTVPHAEAQEMLAWPDDVFLARLHAHFGDRAGAFLSVGRRACFPLRLRRAPQLALPHAVLIGNAAQTLHPVAGQGFNMGLRDAWELAQAILHCEAQTLGDAAMLESYTNRRRLDRNAGTRFTDGLVRLFSNALPGLSAGRAAALTLLDCLPPVKRFVARRMMFGANG